MTARKRKRRHKVNLSRLRKNVSIAHRIYTYIVRDHELLRQYVVELDQRVTDLERNTRHVPTRRGAA